MLHKKRTVSILLPSQVLNGVESYRYRTRHDFIRAVSGYCRRMAGNTPFNARLFHTPRAFDQIERPQLKATPMNPNVFGMNQLPPSALQCSGYASRRLTSLVQCSGYASQHPTAPLQRSGYASRHLTAPLQRSGYASRHLTAPLQRSGYASQHLTALVQCSGYASQHLTALVQCSGYSSRQLASRVRREIGREQHYIYSRGVCAQALW